MDSETAILLKRFEIDFVSGTLNKNDYSISLKKFQSSPNYDLIQHLHILIKYATNNEYHEILNVSDKFLIPLKDFLTEHVPEFSVADEKIKSNYQHLFEYEEEFAYIKQLILLIIGVAALQEFVRDNICGPNAMNVNTYQICYNLFPDDHFSYDNILGALEKSGESILTKISHPELLYLSLLLLFSQSFECCLTHKWWLSRCLFIQQQILPECVPEMHASIISLMKQQEEIEFLKNKEEPLTEIIFYIECAHVYLYYHEINPAEKFITKAQDILSLNIELTGAIGKRTRYQSKATAQLLVKIERNVSKYQSNLVLNSSSLPHDLVLQDDTLLHNIELVDEESNRIMEILPEEQIVLLAHCCLVRRKMAFTELNQEEVMSYVNLLLSQPKIWSLHVKALTLRCQLEKDATRKFERSLTQLEELINSIKKESPPFSERVFMLYSVAFPLSYNLEKLLADMLISLGSVKSALEIYERLHLWEDAVLCYKHLGMTSKAVKVLEELIAKKSRPLLWCYLGDVTDDPEKYKTAWELSNHQHARSQRSLGYYYFKKKDYKNSIVHFNLSVKVNYLQPTVWFSLGFAATECEDFELAACAYRQVVSLDNDNYEAWNNLSNAYIKTKQKVRAWRSLQEALKCNYEEWRVWENFLLVSIDIGAFEDVIRAFHRLLDIKGKHVDLEVLRIVVNSIDKNMLDFHELPSSRLKDKALQLFGRLTSITTNNPIVWELYSILQCAGTDFKNEKEVLEKAVTFQHKAIRSYIQDSSWEKDIKAFEGTLKASLRFAELCTIYIHLLEDPVQMQQQKTSAKYSLQNIVIRAEKACSCFPEQEDLNNILNTTKSAFLSICNL